MLYSLYATTRVTSRNIEIVTTSDLHLINLIINNISSSEYILRLSVIAQDYNQNKSLVYSRDLDLDYTESSLNELGDIQYEKEKHKHL